MTEEGDYLRWLFSGHLVVPTRNPFAPKDGKKERSETPNNKHDNCHWLGPGLKLLTDHILTVDSRGIIQDIQVRDEFLKDRGATSLDDFAALQTTSQSKLDIVRLEDDAFLCPGMIDLHIHAPQYSYTGTATDRPLMGPDGWLETYTFPAERSLRDKAKATKVYNSVVRSTLRNGTTTAVYFASLDLEPCKVLVDAALRYGQRALVGKVCMDRHSPTNYYQSLQDNLQETTDLIEYIHQTSGRRDTEATTILPLILPLITPRFIPTCTPELMAGLGALASEHDCHITSHISESIDEVTFSRHLDATTDHGDGVGRTDAVIFDEHNLLTDKCIMAHGVHLTDSDYDLLKARGSAVAHCPLSNFFFAGGVLPCRRVLERGNLVGLGTDVAGGYSSSMLHSSRMAVVASQALQQQQQQKESPNETNAVIDYRHAFYLATLGGAQSLGLHHRIGTLAVGMEFDAMILSAHVGSSPVQRFDQDTVPDVFQKLCVLGDDRNITRVFVRGRDVTVGT